MSKNYPAIVNKSVIGVVFGLISALGMIGTASDVYSLGVMLFEVITGSPPHRFEGPVKDALDTIANAEPPDVRSLAPHVDRELSMLVHKALAKEVDRRYASAEALSRPL